MKTTNYTPKSSEIISEEKFILTKIQGSNHTDLMILQKKCMTIFGILMLFTLFSLKSIAQGNSGKICLIDGVSTACGAQNLTYTMTNTGGVNNATSYTWSLTAASTASFCSVTSGTTVCISAGVGTFTINLTVQGNGNGNKATCSKVVTINPLPNCAIFGNDPNCTSLNNIYNGPNAPAGKSYGYSWSISNAINASISGSLNGQSITVISGSCQTSYLLNLAVTDLATGCISQCSRNFGFTDNIPPLISAAGDNVTLNCPAEPIFTIPTATDACSSATVIEVTDNTIGDVCSYTRVKSWKAIDACGNESEVVSQAITVQDITAPVISSPGPDMTLDCPLEPVFTAPTATDACSSSTVIEISDNTIGDDCSYTQTKKWKAIDACGNESEEVSQSITIHDITAPSISSPGANATIDCYNRIEFYPPTGFDECHQFSIVEVSDIVDGNTCGYTRTKTWKAVDACGNESETVSQTITILDITAPILTGEGADMFLENCRSEIAFTAPIVEDLCDVAPTLYVVSTNTVQNTDGSITHTRTWEAIDHCGNVSASVDQAITINACQSFCSYTQGYYGNNNGLAQLPDLLSPSLVIGKSGKSLTITSLDVSCLNNNLPSGGPVKILPAGDAQYTPSCNTTTGIPLNNNGRFDNILLGQTITLGLNMRNDVGLGGLIINGTVMTTSNGAKIIPQSVLNALTNIYGLTTVTNLFDLANRALGGLTTGGASLSDINQAISSINEGFDECGELIGFNNNVYKNTVTQEKTKQASIILNAFPNPFNNNTTLEFTANMDEKVKVEIYNVAGAKIITLFNDYVKANEKKSVIFDAQYLSNGLYFCVMTTNDRTQHYKLLLER